MRKRLGRARQQAPELPDGALGLGSFAPPTGMAVVTLHRPWLTEDELAAWFGNSRGTWANLRSDGLQKGPPYYDIPGVGIVYFLPDVMTWAGAYRRTCTEDFDGSRAAARRAPREELAAPEAQRH